MVSAQLKDTCLLCYAHMTGLNRSLALFTCTVGAELFLPLALCASVSVCEGTVDIQLCTIYKSEIWAGESQLKVLFKTQMKSVISLCIKPQSPQKMRW